MGAKYRSKSIVIDGIVFQSKKEGRRWRELRLLEAAGEIRDLRRQVKYTLIPAQREKGTVGKRGGYKPGKIIERECAYIADFVYTDTRTGQTVVEDVKGYKGSGAYAVFTIKRKLMLFVHGIRVQEV